MSDEREENQESGKTLRDKMKAQSLRGVSAMDLLHRFLKSVQDGSMDGHGLVAESILARADDLDEPGRSLLLEQMFPLLMRALEDYATLCLMWLAEKGGPMEAYLKVDKQAIRNFYSQTRKGLGDEAMFKIYGVASPEAMRKKNLIKEGDHYVIESVLGWAWDHYNRLLGNFGRVYHSTVEEADELIGPWQVAYAMSPLGTKMLLDEEGKPETLLLGVGEMPDPADKEKAIPAVYTTPVMVNSFFGEETLHHIDQVCTEIRELAARQLAMLKDPGAGLGRARVAFEKEYNTLKKGSDMVLSNGGIIAGPKPPEDVQPKPGPTPDQKATKLRLTEDPADLTKNIDHEVVIKEEKKDESRGIQKTIETEGGLKIQHTKQLGD